MRLVTRRQRLTIECMTNVASLTPCDAVHIFASMRKLLTGLVMIASLVAGTVGAGAHQQEGSCPMSTLPDCCKRAQSNLHTPEVSMARLCCNLNCSEPGSSGTNSSSSRSQTFDTVLHHEITTADGVYYASLIVENHRFPRHRDSKPKYIQHLALLI